jgi:hypothetical protein
MLGSDGEYRPKIIQGKGEWAGFDESDDEEDVLRLRGGAGSEDDDEDETEDEDEDSSDESDSDSEESKSSSDSSEGSTPEESSPAAPAEVVESVEKHKGVVSGKDSAKPTSLKDMFASSKPSKLPMLPASRSR